MSAIKLVCPFCTRSDFKSQRGLNQHIQQSKECFNAMTRKVALSYGEVEKPRAAQFAQVPVLNRRHHVENLAQLNQNLNQFVMAPRQDSTRVCQVLE